MNLDSWFLRIKEKREKKQEIKMKQKFSFLIDIITENEKNSIKKIQEVYESLEKSNTEIFKEILNTKESIQVLDYNIKKLQTDILESEIAAEENMNDFKNSLIENNDSIKEIIFSIVSKFEKMDKDRLEREKQFENILHTKSEIIKSEAEDVKSLLKLLAVNELVNEIDF